MNKLKASKKIKDFLRKIAAKGGRARAKSMSKKRLSEIGMMGVNGKRKLRRK